MSTGDIYDAKPEFISTKTFRFKDQDARGTEWQDLTNSAYSYFGKSSPILRDTLKSRIPFAASIGVNCANNALIQAESVCGGDHAVVAISLNNLVEINYFARYLKAFKQASKYISTDGRECSIKGLYLYDLIPLLKRALQILINIYGDDHNAVAVIWYNIYFISTPYYSSFNSNNDAEIDNDKAYEAVSRIIGTSMNDNQHEILTKWVAENNIIDN